MALWIAFHKKTSCINDTTAVKAEYFTLAVEKSVNEKQNFLAAIAIDRNPLDIQGSGGKTHIQSRKANNFPSKKKNWGLLFSVKPCILIIY
jgi:hypothetical protein